MKRRIVYALAAIAVVAVAVFLAMDLRGADDDAYTSSVGAAERLTLTARWEALSMSARLDACREADDDPGRAARYLLMGGREVDESGAAEFFEAVC